ncbi:hypothetical protein Stok01_01944 [Sulfurisphaera tokodaii]|uniref:HEPN domain-containing protein n=1 Tax=Sulfurisphaera tokodaii TaxID=111955 RepID=A0A832TK50_9CREN|nr:hypothetical protein [Sulfurisphaera tokodaii]
MPIESFIINWLKEADELLSRGDLVQASEKYYKAAEEAIKYLSKEKKYFMLFRVLEKEKMEGRIVI